MALDDDLSPLNRNAGLKLYKPFDEAFDEVTKGLPSSRQSDQTAQAIIDAPLRGITPPSEATQLAQAPSATASDAEMLRIWQSVSQNAQAGAATKPKPKAGADDGKNFSRGAEIGGLIQAKQTAYGAVGLIGDTFGADSLKQWGLKGYKEASKEIEAISKDSDSFTNALESGDLGKWFSYSSGYLLGQVAQMGAAALAGSAIGSAFAPGGGTVAGAVTGAVGKSAVQTGIRGAIAKMVDKQAASIVASKIERGMVKEVAEREAAEEAVKSVYRTIGATTANAFLNTTQSLGSVYGEAVEEAAKTGQEYSLGKVWLSGVASAAVDSWADSKAVGGLFKAFGGGKSFKGVAMEALKGGFRESLTEGVQTVIERWGADKDLASKEAFKEYIDSAAVGFLGGGMVGTATGAIKKLGQTPDDTTQDKPNLTGTTGGEQNRTLSESFAPSMTSQEIADTLTKDGFGAALAASTKGTVRGDVIVATAKQLGVYDEMRRQYADPDLRAAGQAALEANQDFARQFTQGVFGYALGTNPDAAREMVALRPEPLAALYSESQPTEQQVIRQAFERAGNPDVLGAILSNPVALQQGKTELEDLRQKDGFGALLRSLEQFAQTQPLPGEIVKADKRDSLTGKVQDQNTAPPDDVDLPQGDTSLEINEEEGVFRQSDETDFDEAPATRDETIARFNKIGEKIRGYGDEKRQAREMTSAGQALRGLGFSIAEAGQILSGELRPAGTKIDGTDGQADTTPKAPTEIRSFDDVAALVSQRTGGSPADVRQVKNPKFMKRLASAFGFDLYSYEVDGADAGSTLGTFYRNPQGKGVIALNVGKSDKASLFVLGHEVFHLLEAEFPQQAADLRSRVIKYIKDERLKAYKSHYDALNSGAKSESEVVADVMGQMFTDRKFWDQVASENPTLVQRVLEIIDRLIARFRANRDRMQVGEFITEYEKVRDDLASFVAKYGGKEGVRKTEQSTENQVDSSEQMSDFNPSADAKAYAKAVELIQTGKPMQAARVFRESQLFQKGFGNFNDLIKQNTKQDPKPAPSKPKETDTEEDRDDENVTYQAKIEKRGLLGVVSVRDSQYPTGRKGSPQGDAKDMAMREGASGAIVELASNRPSSSKTTLDQVGEIDENSTVVVLARNGELAGRPLRQETLDQIDQAAQVPGFEEFRVGDMPGVDTQYIEYLRKKQYPFRVFHTESTGNRSKNALSAAVQKPGPDRKAQPKPDKTPVAKQESGQPREQLRLSLPAQNTRKGEPTLITQMRNAIDAKIREMTNASYFEDSIRYLQTKIAEIDSRLKELGTINIEGQTYRARLEEDERPALWGSQDENAYDRFEGGMVFDKKTPKNALLDLRRKLSEDLRVARVGSQRGQARLYTLGMDRLGDFVMQRAQSAIRGGVAPEVVQAAVRPYLDGIMALRNANAIEQDVEPAIDQALAEANRNLAQGDFFDGQRVAAGLLADFRAKLINRNELEQLEQRGLREGDFTLSDLLGAYEALGISPEQRLYAGMKHFSARIRMEDYVAQHGGSVSAMDAWLMDMAQAQKVLSPAQFDKIYSLKEWGRLEFWRQSRQEILSRRNVTMAMRESDSPRIAFRGFLFTRITLEEARNPATIRNASLRQNLTGLFDNLEEAWFQDVAVALRRRPSLANGIFDYRVDGKAFSVAMEGVLSPQEQQAFREWVARIKAGNQKQAEVMARVPFFEILRNDLSLEAVRTAEGAPVVASTPVADADQTGLSADLEANRGRASPRTEYEGLYARIVNGEFDTVQALMDSANRFKALRAGMLDADGVLITDQAAEELNAQALESIQMNAQMEDSSGSQYGASIRGEQRVARTVEEAAARDAQIGAEANVAMQDLSSEEQIQEGEISEFDSETQELADADSEVESEGAAEQGAAAEQSNEETLVFSRALADRNIPMTLEGGAEYRFRRGPAWDLLSGSLVQDAVNRLTAEWKNAPNITVLPNAQHLPEPLRSRVLEKLAQDGAKGLYHEGTIYLFSQHLTGDADIEFTLFHEAYGHLGLRAVLGQKFDDFLNMAYRTNSAVRKAADDLISQGMPKLEAIDEALSDMAAADRQDSAVKNWVGKIISGVRSIGLESVADWMESMTGAELASVLSAARKAVRNGTYSPMSGDLAGTRFRREKFAYEMFATKNGKATGYARYNPITDTWAVSTADGDELSSGYTTRVFDKFEDAEQQIRYAGSVQYRLRHGLYIDDRIAPDLVQLKKQKDNTKYSLWDRRNWSRLWRNATIGFQNQYLPAFEIVDQLIAMGRLSPNQYSLKTALTLVERRTGSALDKFKTDYVQPISKLLEQVGKMGVTKADVDRYLVARHAKERNDHVARINPSMKDGGSGLTYKEAEEIIRKVESSPSADLMRELARKFDQMSNEKVALLYRSGLITNRAFQSMSQYKHYVNLGGRTDADEDDAMLVLGGSKFNAQKPSEKRAFGRGSGNEATDVVARTLLSFESAVVRAEKNRVALSVLTMMEVNLDPSFVLINGQPRIRRLNEETGLVEEAIDENYYGRDDVMVARVNGVPVTMEFKEKGFGTFADAIHGKVAPVDPMSAMELMGKVSRFLGSLLTTYNPVFTAVNFMRDVQSMYLQAVSDKKISLAMANRMLGALPQAIRVAMMAATNGRLNLGLRPNHPMVLAYQEMKANGGLTFFADRKNLDEQIEEINDLMSGKSGGNLKKALRTLPALLEMMADVSEIAPRLAAYSVVKDSGFTTTQAAVFSGEITVNFNMRGSFKAPRQLFVFFNPAIQGTEKIWRLAKEDPRKFAAVSASMMAMGMLVSMIGRAASGEDEEGRDNIDKLPLYKRATSMVFKADAMGGAPIPVPYGWNVPYAAGVFLMDWLQGKQDMKTTVSRVAKTAVESFSPIGSGALDSKDSMTFALKFFSPTAILPVVEYIANENRFGAPIYKADSLFGKAETPDAQRYFRGVSPISRAFTEFLTKESGGNAYKAGAIDVNPATVDHIIRSYLPGMPSEAYKLASVAVRKATGERVKSEPWPLADRFSARVPDGYETGSFMRAAKLIETTYREYKEIRDDARRAEIRQEFPGIGQAHAIVSSTEYQLRGVRKQINDLEKRSMTQEEKMERKTQLLDREDQILSRANSRLLKVNDKIRSAMMNNE